jgi:5-methylcytosine-specific restriction endonuclease McrA
VSHSPFYDSRQWTALRQQQLATEPFCRFCRYLGRYTRATQVDHIKPHHGRSSLFFNVKNLQSLCTSCHSRLKQALERRGHNAGCTVSGRPRSRLHHWNRRQPVG